MKKWKMFLYFLIFAIVLMPFNAYASDSPAQKDDIDLEHENEMNTQLNDLMLYFSEQGYISSGQQYPDFYGGAYITEDRSELVVCVTDTSSEICDIIKAGTKNPNVVIQKVVHSYSELQQHSIDVLHGHEKISMAWNNKVTWNNTPSMEIVGAGVSVKDNAVTVTVKNYDKLMMVTRSVSSAETAVVDVIKRTVSTQKGSFNYVIEHGGYIQDQSSYPPGTRVTPTVGGGFTMGYRGKIAHPITGEILKGFWTAGHCINEDSEVYVNDEDYGRIYIGTCIAQRNNGNVDAAFVALADQEYVTITNETKYGETELVGNYVVTFAENALVYICGQASGEEEYGYIKNTSHSFIDNQVYFYDFVAADYTSLDGDSGAAIYALVNGDYALCGIHKGRDTQNASRGVFTKTTNINAIWTMYAWND